MTERILHYATADLCVFPSIHENFGIVSLEAMSMKKPVVVGAHGVVNRLGGKEVLKDPDRARRWGENGRKRVLEYFTWRKAAEQAVHIY